VRLVKTQEKQMKKISHDWWSVLAALAAVALVRIGILPNVGW